MAAERWLLSDFYRSPCHDQSLRVTRSSTCVCASACVATVPPGAVHCFVQLHTPLTVAPRRGISVCHPFRNSGLRAEQSYPSSTIQPTQYHRVCLMPQSRSAMHAMRHHVTESEVEKSNNTSRYTCPCISLLRTTTDRALPLRLAALPALLSSSACSRKFRHCPVRKKYVTKITYTSSNFASSISFSCCNASLFSASSFVLSDTTNPQPPSHNTDRSSRNHSQNISALAIILQYHRVILPQRRAVRHSEQSDAQLRGVLHHQALHLRRHERCRLIKHSILHPSPIV